MSFLFDLVVRLFRRSFIEVYMTLIAPYYRCSTQKQGESGLGLEAQQNSVEQYAKSTGSRNLAPYFRKMIRTKTGEEHVLEGHGYLEIESGKVGDRPELAKALAYARQAKATLVVAKLCRLARNTRFLLGIVESGVDVFFCDLPTIQGNATGKFILTQMAAVAELEAGMISDRTRDALAAYKARGGKLGGQRPECRNLNPDAIAKGRLQSAKVRTEVARKVHEELAPVILSLRSQGLTMEKVALRLNDQGYQTRWGKPWNHALVSHFLKRCRTHYFLA
jgi:DNA invertase Pin-like site-specific DNA recombinase